MRFEFRLLLAPRIALPAPARCTLDAPLVAKGHRIRKFRSGRLVGRACSYSILPVCRALLCDVVRAVLARPTRLLPNSMLFAVLASVRCTKGGRCLRRRSGEGFSGRCPSDGYSGLLSRRFPGMRGAFFAALSVSSRQSKKMTCGITKKYSQNSIMTSKNYPMTIIDCHRIISYSGRSGIWPILTRNGGILV